MNGILRNFLCFFVFTLCILLSSNYSKSWAIVSTQLKLSKVDFADLKRLQAELNTTKTMNARFLQMSSNGEHSEGSLLLKRPGKLRLEYDLPNPLLVIADGTYISFIDRHLDEATTLLLNMTQAAILLKEKISFFSDELIVVGFKRVPGSIKVALTKEKKSLDGKLTLIFSDSPLELRKWIVTDAQQITTTISLLETKINSPIENKHFVYVPKTKYNFDN